jgi:hypothetical protein
MRIAALLLVLAATGPPPVEVVYDGAVEIAPGQVRTLAIPVRHAPRRVACSWVVHRGAPVRLLLLPAEEAEAWLRGRAYPLAATAGHARTGSLTHLASAPAELVLVMERQADPRSATRLRLTARLMDPSLPFPAPATPADRRRGAALVWGSLGLFAAAAALSAARIRRNWRRRGRG